MIKKHKKLSELNNSLDYMKLSQKDFYLKKSSKSAQIVTLDENGLKKGKQVFSNKGMDFKAYHLSKKLMKQLSPYLDDFEKQDDLYYYFLNENFLGSHKTVMNIDIKSAYLKVLSKTGLIPNWLIEEINNLPKESRLICLGMLAYEPEIFHFRLGEFFN